MEKKTGYKGLFIAWLLLCCFACSPTKYIAENEYLLNQVELNVEDGQVSGTEIKKNIRQKPNTRILGAARFHLGLYNLSGRDGEKRINKWLRSIGEAPVVYSEFLTDRSIAQIKQYLNNKGYYRAEVWDSVAFRKKKAYIRYFVVPGVQTSIGEFNIRDRYNYVNNEVPDTLGVMKEVVQDSVNTLLQKGLPLDVDLMEQERDRVTRMLRRKGYFNFSKNLVQFYADTNYSEEKQEQARVVMSIANPSAGQAAFQIYRIGKMNINFDYDPLMAVSGRDSLYTDSTYGDYGILFRERLKIKPKLIVETLQFRSGELYNIQKVVDSYARLQALNLFKFINIVFREQVDSCGQPILACEIQLTPIKRQSYNVFLEGTHNSGNIGVGGNFTYNHRNIFGCGENLSLSFWGALKKEQFNEDKIFSTKELGVEMKFITPQFWMPVFRMADFRRNFAPKTSVSLSYSYEYTPFYDRRIASAKFGYLWRKSNQKWRYNFDLIDLNYVMMQQVDSNFFSGLINEYVKSAYTSHMILSANFSAIYSDQVLNSHGSYNYFRFNLETSGNLLWAMDKLLVRGRENEDEHEILGVPYAQYIKVDGEYRFSYYLNPINTIVYRVFLGCGYPYGNMKTLPFEEAYYGGGANGIRAWQSRTLGPGSYVSENRYPNSVGNFKLEANVEYRFKLFWLLEGALFLDAGNIWNINRYDDRKGTRLGSEFYKQIAVGTGTGLRVDANFFLLRFDWGIKMRDPAQPEGRRFVLINNGKWMKRTVFNIAIGYPF